MLLNIPSLQGNLQILEDGTLRIMKAFNTLVWQVPCSTVTKFTVKYSAIVSVAIAIQTSQGTYVVEMVTRQNFQKLQSFFPGRETTALQGKEWESYIQGVKRIAPSASVTQARRSPSPGQFQYAPQQPLLPHQRWWQRFQGARRRTKLGIGCVVLLSVLFLCVCTAANSAATTAVKTTRSNGSSSSISQATTAPTQAVVVAVVTATQTSSVVPTQTPTTAPTPTAAPTQRPIATPTPVPQPTQAPAPTQPPPAPKPTPTSPPTGVNGNPWGYDFVPGNLIYSPPSAFCSYFQCVSTFWTATRGYVAECASGSYTHSGGVSGACSRNGGVSQPLYSH